jgi:hypothetical protein
VILRRSFATTTESQVTEITQLISGQPLRMVRVKRRSMRLRAGRLMKSLGSIWGAPRPLASPRDEVVADSTIKQKMHTYPIGRENVVAQIDFQNLRAQPSRVGCAHVALRMSGSQWGEA